MVGWEEGVAISLHEACKRALSFKAQREAGRILIGGMRLAVRERAEGLCGFLHPSQRICWWLAGLCITLRDIYVICEMMSRSMAQVGYYV